MTPDRTDPFWQKMEVENLEATSSKKSSPGKHKVSRTSDGKLQDSGLGSSLSCMPKAVAVEELNTSRESGEITEEEVQGLLAVQAEGNKNMQVQGS